MIAYRKGNHHIPTYLDDSFAVRLSPLSCEELAMRNRYLLQAERSNFEKVLIARFAKAKRSNLFFGMLLRDCFVAIAPHNEGFDLRSPHLASLGLQWGKDPSYEWSNLYKKPVIFLLPRRASLSDSLIVIRNTLSGIGR